MLYGAHQDDGAGTKECLGTKANDAIVAVPAYSSDSQRQATRDAGSVTEFVLTNFGKGTGHNEYYVDLNWMCNMRLEAFDLYLLVVFLFAASLVGEIAMQRVGLPFGVRLTFTTFWLRAAKDLHQEIVRTDDLDFRWKMLTPVLVRSFRLVASQDKN